MSYNYLFEEDGNIAVIKWKKAANKSIKDNPAAPNINLRPNIQFTRDNLRRRTHY
jgi:hypothetical protein